MEEKDRDRKRWGDWVVWGLMSLLTALVGVGAVLLKLIGKACGCF